MLRSSSTTRIVDPLISALPSAVQSASTALQSVPAARGQVAVVERRLAPATRDQGLAPEHPDCEHHDDQQEREYEETNHAKFPGRPNRASLVAKRLDGVELSGPRGRVDPEEDPNGGGHSEG